MQFMVLVYNGQQFATDADAALHPLSIFDASGTP